jgi:Ca2+-binding EF-hand superfamily protein
MDDNGDGVLSPAELTAGMRKIGINVSKERVRKLVSGLDADGNNSVDYREFLRMLSEVDLRNVIGMLTYADVC